MANGGNDVSYREAWYLSNVKYPNVVQFSAIFERNEFTGGYLCKNCRTVVLSSDDKNNQRTFTNHFNKCEAFMAKGSDSKGEEETANANGNDE